MVHNEKTTIELTIRDRDYELKISTKTFGTFAGEAYLIKIARLLTKNFAAFGGVEMDGTTLKNIDVSFVCKSLYESLDEKQIVNLVNGLMDNTRIQFVYDDNLDSEFTTQEYNLGKPKELDLAFSGKLSAIYDVLKFILEVNFEDFLSRLGNLSGNLQEKFQEITQKVQAVQEAVKNNSVKLSGKLSKES